MSRTNLRLSAMAASFALAMAGGAHAADVLFTITETGEDISFTLPASPTPSSFSTNNFFVLKSITVDDNGSMIAGDTLLFANGRIGGGGLEDTKNTFRIDDVALYSGSESAPNFLAGTYTGGVDNQNEGSAATVKITDVSSAPEPATWTLMLVGFGGLGGALRARRIRSIGYRRPFG